MGLEVKVLDLGDIELDTSFLVLALEPGVAQQVPTFGFLITGGEAPIVVDTGFSHPEIMGNLGMKGWFRENQGMEHAARQARPDDGRRALRAAHAPAHRPRRLRRSASRWRRRW